MLALGGAVGRDALARQLAPIAPRLEHELLPDCGHIVPADAPLRRLDEPERRELQRLLEKMMAPA